MPGEGAAASVAGFRPRGRDDSKAGETNGSGPDVAGSRVEHVHKVHHHQMPTGDCGNSIKNLRKGGKKSDKGGC